MTLDYDIFRSFGEDVPLILLSEGYIDNIYRVGSA